MAKISVVLPAFNAESYLGEALDSVLGQKTAPAEVVVVDDGSTDGTASVAGRFGTRVSLIRQENRGPAAARNSGIRRCTGELIAFLDADDVWPDLRFEPLLNRLEIEPRSQVVLGRTARLEAPTIGYLLPSFGSAVFRRTAFDRVGEIDDTLGFSEDHDWFFRARETGLPMAVIDSVTQVVRRHELNMTRGRGWQRVGLLGVLRRSIRRRSGRLPSLTELARPLVSVIIPVYNGEKFLAETLRNVFAQDYRPMEVIVVDDGSTDGSPEILKRFPELKVLRQENQGPGVARNAGLAAARGEMVAFIDQDDLWDPGKLGVQVGHLVRHPETAVCYVHGRTFLEQGMALPNWARKETLEGLPDYTPGALLARRAAFESVGTFCADLKSGSDSDWYVRARDAGVRIDVVPRILLGRRIHGGNQSADPKGSRELLTTLRRSLHRRRESVSVVIPAYNIEKYIGEAVRSALDQTRPPDEVVVVDDGSTDGTLDALAAFGDRIRVIRQENQGPNGARNSGIRSVRGTYLALMDGDDLWLPAKLERQLAAVRKDPSIDLCFTDVEHFHSSGGGRYSVTARRMQGIYAGALLVLRKTFLRIGFFDMSLRIGEFIDWGARAREAGLRTKVLDEVLVRRRIHGANTSIVEQDSRIDITRLLRRSLARRRSRVKDAPDRAGDPGKVGA